MKLKNVSKIVLWCAEEVEHQKDGPLDVSSMFNAWRFYTSIADATRFEERVLEGDILTLATILKGYGNYRTIPVGFSNGDFAIAPAVVGQAIHSLLTHQDNLTALEFYIEFERIHPFVDGNGRIGSILFNYLNGTLDKPVHVPLPTDFQWR